MWVGGKMILDRENSKCKCPEAGAKSARGRVESKAV